MPEKENKFAKLEAVRETLVEEITPEQIAVERIRSLLKTGRVRLRDLGQLLTLEPEKIPEQISEETEKAPQTKIRRFLAELTALLGQVRAGIEKAKQKRVGLRLSHRLEQAIDRLQEEAIVFNEEMTQRSDLRKWLFSLAPNLRVVLKKSNGDEELETWQLLAIDPETNQVVSTFELGRSFWVLTPDETLQEFVETNESLQLGPVLSRIPQDIVADYQRRREGLLSLGFSSSQEVDRFYQTSFLEEEINLETARTALKTKGKAKGIPPLLRYLASEQSELLSQAVAILQKDRNRTLCFRILTSVPESLREGLRDLAADTQHGYLDTWLGGLIQNGIPPYISRADRKKRAKKIQGAQNEVREAVAEIMPDNFRASRILEEIVRCQVADEMDWEQVLQRVRHFSRLFLACEIRSKTMLTGEEQALAQRINEFIDRDLSPEYALFLLIKEDAAEVSREAIKILRSLPFVAGMVQGLHHLHLGELAAALAGTAGDTLTEISELSTFIKRQGWSTREFLRQLLRGHPEANKLLARMGIVGPTILCSAALSSQAYRAVEHWGPYVGGLYFAFSATFGTLFTQLISIKLFASSYANLVREGKLPEARPQGLTEEEWYALLDQVGGEQGLIRALERLRAQGTEQIVIEECIRQFRSLLQEQGLTEAQIAERADDLRQALQTQAQKLGRLFHPAFITQTKAGFREAFVTNPARKAIGLGIALSLILVPPLMPLGIRYAFMLAVLGDMEALSTGALANLFVLKGGERRFLQYLVKKRKSKKV